MPAWLDWIVGISSILGFLFALLAFLESRAARREFKRERERQTKKVNIILRNGAREIELPIEVRRAELTRAEIQGRLGLLPMKRKGERYSLSYLNTAEFLQRVNEIADGLGDSILTIPVNEDEFNQFDLAKENGAV